MYEANGKMDRKRPNPIKTQASVLSTISKRHENVQWFFNDMRVFVIFNIISNFFGSMLRGYYFPMMTSIERQFQLTGSMLGFLRSAMEIGRIPLLPFLPFFGARMHIPRLMGAMDILRALSIAMLVLPHFVFGQRIITLLKSSAQESTMTADEELINVGNFTYTTTICHLPDHNGTLNRRDMTAGLADDSKIAYGILIASYILFGVSGVADITLGRVYLDNNFDKTQLPLLIGIMRALMPLGPVVGNLLSILMSRLYVDLSEPIIDFDDPKWISAWWLGLLIIMVPPTILGPLTCLFPRRMRKKGSINIKIPCLVPRRPGGQPAERKGDQEDVKKVKTQLSKEEKQMNEEHDKEQAEKDEEAFKKMSEQEYTVRKYPAAVCRIMKNPIFLLLVVDAILLDFAWSGWPTFAMKYYEQVFRVPAWKVQTINTVANVLVMPIGSLCGGLIVTRLRPTYARVTLLMIANLFMFAGLSVGRMFMTCGDSTYAGLDFKGPQQLMGECNAGCECNLAAYSPVCDNGITYFSACHAGCEMGNITLIDGIVKPRLKDFYDCNCTATGFAVPGKCEGECDLIYLYVGIRSTTIFVWALTGSAGFLMLIRSVGYHDKAFAVGISVFISALLGSLPSAPLIGMIIDSTCRVFQQIRGRQGNCWIHDTDAVRFRMYGWTIGFMSAQIIVNFIIYYLAKKKNLKLFDEDDPMVLRKRKREEEMGEMKQANKDSSTEKNGNVNADNLHFNDKEMADEDNHGFEGDNYSNREFTHL